MTRRWPAISVLALLIMSYLALITFPSAWAGPSRLLEKDDWDVTGVETVQGETIVLTGNLTIGPSGSLELVDTVLEMNLSYSGQFWIRVEEGGTLELDNVTIGSKGPGLAYDLTVLGSLMAEGSRFHDHGNITFIASVSSLNMTELRDGPGGTLSAIDSDLSLLACDIIVDNGANAMELENSAISMISTVVKNVGQADIDGINVTARSNVSIEGGGIYNFTNGIHTTGSTISLKDVLIRDSKQVGIWQHRGNTTVADSRLVDNHWGISCLDGMVDLSGNDISATRYGAYLNRCQGTVVDNTFHDSEMGLEVSAADATVKGNTFRANVDGLRWSYSDLGTVEGNLLLDNKNGMTALHSNIELKDCRLSNEDLDLKAIGTIKVVLTNTTYEKLDIQPDAKVTVQWYLTIKAELDAGGPASFAQGSIDDARGDPTAFMVDGDGLVGPLTLKQKEMTRWHTTWYSPYNISASLSNAKGMVTVDLSATGTVMLTLRETDIYLVDIDVSDPSPSVGEWAQISITVGTTAFPVYDVEIFLYVDGSLSTSSKVDLMGPQTEVSFPFSATAVGDYEVEVVLDPNLRLEEANETNNVGSIVVPVGKGPSNGGKDGKPDLHLIGLSQSNTDPFSGSVLTLEVEIQNSGNATAEYVVVRVSIDGKVIGSRTIRTVEAGGVGVATFDWQAEEGNHTVRVEIDPLNSIDESNEMNNDYESVITVGGNGIDDPFANMDSLIPICLGVVIVFIVIIIGLLALMARKPKTPGTYPQQGYAPGGDARPYAPTYVSSTKTVTPTTIEPKERRTTARAQASQAGPARCKRCGSTDIKLFDDGHKQCKTCRKIFF